MIVARDVRKSFGKLLVLDGVSLSIAKGEVAVLIGPSGSGKSTFVRCLNGLEIPDSGEVEIDGIHLSRSRKKIAKIRSETGMVFQHYNLFPHLNVMQNLILAQKVVRKRKESEASGIAMEYLSKVGLSDKKESLPSELSGGQAQRAAIARALCMNPKIMLFDEPTSALDPVMTAEVLAVIRRLAEEGMTMIVISHEMNFARDVASKIAFMHDGKIIETDSPDKFLNSPRHEAVRNFIASYKSNGSNGN